MKNSKEMADAVFRIRDEYMEKKRHRERLFGRAAMIAVPACLALVMIAGGYAILSDRQMITADRTAETVMETAAVTARETIFESELIGAEETESLKDTAETSTLKAKTTKKQTETETSLEPIEGEMPETEIPDGATEAQPEIFTMTSETAVTTRMETSTTLSVTEVNETAMFQIDSDTDGLPESTETVSAAMEISIESLYAQHPTVTADREYVCAKTIVTEDMLGDVMIESETATFYHLAENDRIAVRFAGTEIYIVYEAKEDQ